MQPLQPVLPEDAIFAQGPWTHRDISASGARFHAVTAGDGPLVLLLHGFPTYWWTWRYLIPELADAGYRVVAMDLRGYAGSDHPPRGYDMFTLSRDITSVIRSLGERSATVVGHGIGGLLAWATAALHPEVVDRLAVLSAPHPLRMRYAITHDRSQAAASSYVWGFQRPWYPERNLVADNSIQVMQYLQAWSADPAWPSEDVGAHYRAAFQIGNTAHCAVEYYRWLIRSIPRSDGRRFATELELAPIGCPVLQIHGSADSALLPQTAMGSNRFVNGAYAWRLLPGVGHFVHEEATDLVNATILDWLETDPPWNDPVAAQRAIEPPR